MTLRSKHSGNQLQSEIAHLMKDNFMRLIKEGVVHSERGEKTLTFVFNNYLYLIALGLSCSMWDLVPWPGVEPGSLHWERRVLATGPPEKSWWQSLLAGKPWEAQSNSSSFSFRFFLFAWSANGSSAWDSVCAFVCACCFCWGAYGGQRRTHPGPSVGSEMRTISKNLRRMS